MFLGKEFVLSLKEKTTQRCFSYYQNARYD